MKVLLVGSEVMPFAATGGLGDVLGSLPEAIRSVSEGEIDVRVVLPLHGAIGDEWRAKMTVVAEFEVSLAWRRQYCGVRMLKKDGVTYYFIDNEYYFNRDSLYGNQDDGERFAFFGKAALEMLPYIGFYPDILHAHDWQGALSIIYLNQKYHVLSGYAGIRTVFTIHNIEYQGRFLLSLLWDMFELTDQDRPLVEYDGQINLMKGAIECADRVTTVSPRYAEEICQPVYGHGLDRLLSARREKLSGILNGIDYKVYNPAQKSAETIPFTWRSQDRKYKNKAALQKELKLPRRQEIPLLSVISRLVSHKGLDLISEMVYNLLEETPCQLVVLGRGEERLESFFSSVEKAYPHRVRALITYDRALANRIYAATDIFLMPSQSEPCGLSQMIASRFGAIPVTRETGGLYDSIKNYGERNGKIFGNGFTFADYTAEALLEQTKKAITLWRDPEKRKRLIGKIMRTDFSWGSSAEQYLALYQSLQNE